MPDPQCVQIVHHRRLLCGHGSDRCDEPQPDTGGEECAQLWLGHGEDNRKGKTEHHLQRLEHADWNTHREVHRRHHRHQHC